MDTADIHGRVISWFLEHRRDLPWREPECSPWGVLVSEIMLQQTPVVRVLPRWTEWMSRWPTPADLAAAPTGEVLRAWSGLGYPRRALRLQETASVVQESHGGTLPRTEEALRALPGVGAYTAAAVAAFAHGARTAVLDTNVRRVLARALRGEAGPPGAHLRADETRWAAGLLPREEHDSVLWNAGLMELGALVCTARSPRCDECPLADSCRWLARGKPAAATPARRPQAWHGTDRQLRGAVMAALTSGEYRLPRRALIDAGYLQDSGRGGADGPMAEVMGDAQRQALAAYFALDADAERRGRILAGLLADGLVAEDEEGRIGLPG